MKSPKDMRIIQIDITNACIHKCSNCTRFCGHHKKPFFMDYEIFKKAVDSLDGYMGTIGVMGGEPTLHPEFEKIARYIGSKYPQLAGTDKQMLRPQAEFMKAIQDLEFTHTCGYDSGLGKRQTVIGPGLWSAMGKQYQKHYEVIQDTFKYQALNDHVNPMYHQPALITRKELNISDEEWISLRDNCWIQNEWSAAITPKGAFFCEVAGALDMLFDGPGGWPIEPGWWKRRPEEFGEQLHWCELCGLACQTFMRNANEEVDDVSPVLYQKLAEQGSPRLKAGHVNLLQIENGVIAEGSKAAGKRFSAAMPYTESYEARFNSTKSVLYPKGFEAVYQFGPSVTKREIETAAASMKGRFEAIYALCENIRVADLCREVLAEDHCKIFDLETKGYGEIVEEILKHGSGENYIVMFQGSIHPKASFAENMKKYIFNPGVLITLEIKEKTAFLDEWLQYDGKDREGRMLLFNRQAYALREFDREGIHSFSDLAACWSPEKILSFDEKLFYYPPETSIREKKKYAIYGNGGRAGWVYDCIKNNGGEFVCIVDSDEKKQGADFYGKTVESPEYLRRHMSEIDYVLISSLFYYGEVKEAILKLGFDEKQLAFV